MRRRLAIPVLLLATVTGCMRPSWGAAALLHPSRRPVTAAPTLPHRDFTVESDGATLRGWLFPASAPPRGVTLVYLHGVADNRASGVWLAERFTRLGFDVVTYDQRAHGASTGDACTYGFYEKRDLSRVLDALGIQRAVVIGVSLGAAVALQGAAEDPRIAGVVSVAVFADIETIARHRAPWFATGGQIREALELASREARFDPHAVSPVHAAARIPVPVLVIHGERDRETPPEHSRRVFAALPGPKELRMVRGAGHNDALAPVIEEVERWVARGAPPASVTTRVDGLRPGAAASGVPARRR